MAGYCECDKESSWYVTDEECLPTELLRDTYEAMSDGASCTGQCSHYVLPISRYVFEIELGVRMILQEHFPCYAILQFVIHTSVTEVIYRVRQKKYIYTLTKENSMLFNQLL